MRRNNPRAMHRFMGLFMVTAVVLAMIGFSLMGGRLYLAGTLLLACAAAAAVAFWKSIQQ